MVASPTTLQEGAMTATISTQPHPTKRPRFTKNEKAQIIADYDQATTPTERGIVLRKWGTYQQNVSRWKREDQMTTKKRAPKPSPTDTRLLKQNAALEKKLAASQDRVSLLEELVQAQGKVLGLHAKNSGSPSQE